MQADLLEHHLKDQLQRKELFDDFFWHRVRWNAVKASFPKEKKFSVLDVGAGTGQAGRYLAQDFPKATYNFTEPLESLRGPLNKTYGSQSDFFEKKSYDGIDFIICLDVIEHIKDDEAFVKNLILKSSINTRIIFTVPAMSLLWSQWDASMGHFRRYNKKKLRNLFQMDNVHRHRLSYLFPEMVPAALWRKLSQGNNEGGEFPTLHPIVNQLFYTLGNTSRLLGPLNPFGSSLLIEVSKR